MEERRRECDQFTIRGVIHGFPADEDWEERPAVRRDVVPEVGLRLTAARYHDLFKTHQRVAYGAEEFMLRADGAVVLPRVMLFVVDLRYVVGPAADADDLRVMVIEPDERV